MPEKDISFKTSWLSQFGLYRYDEAEKNQPKWFPSTMLYVLCGLFCGASLMFVVVLNIGNSLNDDVSQIIDIDNRNYTIETENSIHTTLAYINQQLERLQNEENDSFTTPMGNEGVSDDEDNSDYIIEPRFEDITSEPKYIMKRHLRYENHRMDLNDSTNPNHRRINVQIPITPRPFKHLLFGKPPSAFHVHPNHTFPGIPKDYSGDVDSIQDIIDKVTDKLQSERSESFPEYIAKTGRKVRIGGTYRQRKNDEKIENNKIHMSNYNAAASPFTPSPPVINDPFYTFKPLSMADINLMAMREFRFAPKLANEHDPHSNRRRRTRKPNQANLDIYQQLIRANNLRSEAERSNSRQGKVKQQKPFSLMLDVYPMQEDDPPPPVIKTNSVRRPVLHPVVRQTIRRPKHEQNHVILNSYEKGHHSPPLHMEKQYFRNMHFPQLPPYRMHYPIKNIYDDESYYNSDYPNNLHKFHDYNESPERHPPTHTTENRPSQITVHLNLFPKNKRQLREKLDHDYSERMEENQRIIRKLKDRILHQISIPNEPIPQAATDDIETLNSSLETTTTISSISHHLHKNILKPPSTDDNHLIDSTAIPQDTSSKQPSIDVTQSNEPHHQTPIQFNSSPPSPLNLLTIDRPSIVFPRHLTDQPPTINPTTAYLDDPVATQNPNRLYSFNPHYYDHLVPTIIPIEPRQQYEEAAAEASLEGALNHVIDDRMAPI